MSPKKEDAKPDETNDDFVVGDDDDKGDAKAKKAKGDSKGDSQDLSETEELAIELGWNPDHEGDEIVDAKTFILRSRDIQDTMRKTNKESKRTIDKLQKGIENIKDYYRKLDDTRASKAEVKINQLKKERDEAIEEGDLSKVHGLDSDIKSAKKEAEPLMDEDADNPIFDEWVEDNDWYGKDVEMTEYADGQAELEKYHKVRYDRVLKMIEKSTKEIFSDKFKSNGKPSADKKTKVTSKVEGTKPRKSNREPTVSDLDAEQKEIMKNILSVDESLTQKEYLKGLREVGEI